MVNVIHLAAVILQTHQICGGGGYVSLRKVSAGLDEILNLEYGLLQHLLDELKRHGVDDMLLDLRVLLRRSQSLVLSAKERGIFGDVALGNVVKDIGNRTLDRLDFLARRLGVNLLRANANVRTGLAQTLLRFGYAELKELANYTARIVIDAVHRRVAISYRL